MNPLSVYNKQRANGKIHADNLQQKVVAALDKLYYKLLEKPKKRWFRKIPPTFYGIYVYGKVGRGKTFLMDLFAQSLPAKKMRRQHFHEFMLWVHAQLHLIKNKQNPLDIIIKNLSQDISVLCLDEFLVHDITDAMLLAGILLALEKNGVSLITTSNVNPVDLYYGGLQRKKFLPAIAWMQKNMEIMHLDGDFDHRQKITPNKSSNNWLQPINEQNRTLFEQFFNTTSHRQNIHLTPITINKREISVIKRSEKSIMFAFEVLCKDARNAADYLKICSHYDSIFLLINSPIAADDRNTVKRFITLIDVLYDTNTALYVLGECEFRQLYHGQSYAFEMQRTHSRLTQMVQ